MSAKAEDEISAAMLAEVARLEAGGYTRPNAGRPPYDLAIERGARAILRAKKLRAGGT